ncbi:MAG TPA: DUF1801 domain-containing protein [Thermoplasmata archaeon]|nr:DUF1801 domain-containing protein [Thermoplasmata archaeon]
MNLRTRSIPRSTTAGEEIDAIIEGEIGWKRAMLLRLRAVVRHADPDMIEEVKWKKPSNPAGVPVWSRGGIVCVGGVLKNAVRLTFPTGARLKDPKHLFNACLSANWMWAIDFAEGDPIDTKGVTSLVREAVKYNSRANAK